jgi:glycosyltransferase involved in cell wall biosynthesis
LRSLSVIIPAFNEEKRLPDTLEKLTDFFETLSLETLEIIIVDDGSTDGTGDTVRRRAATDPRFRLLRNPGNCGKGYAVRHGMLEAKGDWRLLTDADLSTPITELRSLYRAAVDQGAEVAIGSRALDRSLIARHQPFFREFGGRFFNIIMRRITGLAFADTQCGFKLYRADAAEAIFSRQILNGFSFDVEDMFIARRLGIQVVEVPVAWANAEGTKVNLRSTLRAFTDLLRIRSYARAGRYEGKAAFARE